MPHISTYENLHTKPKPLLFDIGSRLLEIFSHFALLTLICCDAKCEGYFRRVLNQLDTGSQLSDLLFSCGCWNLLSLGPFSTRFF